MSSDAKTCDEEYFELLSGPLIHNLEEILEFLGEKLK